MDQRDAASLAAGATRVGAPLPWRMSWLLIGMVGGGVVALVLSALILSPTSIGAASVTRISVGRGYTDVSPKQLVRTSDNRLWVVAANCDTYPDCSSDGTSHTLRVYRADQTGVPSSFTRQHQSGEPAAIVTAAVAVDGADILHILWAQRLSGIAQNLKYTTFDTATNQWSSTIETIDSALNYDDVGQGEQGGALALDASGVPHIVYLKGALPNRRVYYRNRVGGGWSASIQLDDVVAYTGNQKAWHVNLAFDTQGRVLVAWLRGSFNGNNDGTIFTRVRATDGTWGNTVNVSGDGTARVTIDQSTSLLVTVDNRYHLTYVNQPNDYIRYAYSDNQGQTWTHNNPGGGTQATHNPSLGPNGNGGVRIYGHGTPVPPPDGHGDNLFYFDGPGGAMAWGNWTLYTTGAFDSSVNTRWSQYFFHHPGLLDIAYWADPYPNDLYVSVEQVAGSPTPTATPTTTPLSTSTPTPTPFPGPTATPTPTPPLGATVTPTPTPPLPLPGGAATWYFAEGWTGAGFDQYFTIMNPNSVDAAVTITYYLTSGGLVEKWLTAPANRRTTVVVHDDTLGVGRDQAVSARVASTNGVGIVVERPMYFTYGHAIDGGHNALGAVTPRPIWYFAEGHTGNGFDEFLTIMNPNPRAVEVAITYYLTSGEPIEKRLTALAHARTTVAVHESDQGIGRGQTAGIKVSSIGGDPLVVERPMYFAYNQTITGGHTVLGARQPERSWYFAEGWTGTGFDEYLTILNPNNSQAEVTVTYYLTDDSPRTTRLTVDANQRATIAVHDSVQGVGRHQAVSARVTTTHPGGIVVERPMYFTYNGTITGGHNVLGAIAPRLVWYFAEGYTGAGFDEFLTILNPHSSPAEVTITYFLTSGPPVEKRLTAPSSRRTTVAVHDANQGVGRDQAVSARVASTNGVGIVVERPMYFTYGNGSTGGHTVSGYSP